MEDEECRRCFQVRSSRVFNFHVWKPGRDGAVEVIVLMKDDNEKFKIWKGTIDFLNKDVIPNIPDKAWLVKEAWKDYDNSRKILSITDISIKVSTNHVYRIILKDGSKVIVKISDYGYVSNFSEDHSIINALSINLNYPFKN